MKLKPSITTLSFLFLLLLLLTLLPCFSTGRMYVEEVDSEVYDIDYRGPETHSYLPPPDRSNSTVKSSNIREGVMSHSESKGLGAGNSEESTSVKKQP